MSVWFAYADESGIQDGAPFCLVSGFVASPRQWKLFDKEWNKVLNDYKVPYFHSREFFAHALAGKSSPYYGWNDQKAFGFLRSLLEVIERRKLYPISGVVDIAAFDSFSEHERKLLTGGHLAIDGRTWVTHGAPSKPYYLAFQHLMVRAMKTAPDDSRIEFMFANQRELQSRAIEIFYEVKTLWGEEFSIDRRLSTISYGEPKEKPELQAADLHAFSWYTYADRGNEIVGKRRLAMERLARRGSGVRVFDKRALEILLSRLPTHTRTVSQV